MARGASLMAIRVFDLGRLRRARLRPARSLDMDIVPGLERVYELRDTLHIRGRQPEPGRRTLFRRLRSARCPR